ncbi:unnamed protein product [Dicrocoelium dendriticum]|nr:unnamed protein product [Dicrocoelium dendriticum]
MRHHQPTDYVPMQFSGGWLSKSHKIPHNYSRAMSLYRALRNARRTVSFLTIVACLIMTWSSQTVWSLYTFPYCISAYTPVNENVMLEPEGPEEYWIDPNTIR